MKYVIKHRYTNNYYSCEEDWAKKQKDAWAFSTRYEALAELKTRPWMANAKIVKLVPKSSLDRYSFVFDPNIDYEGRSAIPYEEIRLEKYIDALKEYSEGYVVDKDDLHEALTRVYDYLQMLDRKGRK